MAYIGSTPVPQGIKETQSFTATAGQTTFNTLGYTNGNNISVFLNGVRLINGTDYTATNGSDIVLTAAASASDVLDFETFNEFNLVNQNLTTPTFTDSASVTSTTTANVSVSGDTTATVTLKNNTHEDTDGGRESTLIFKGEQSGGEISTLAEIEASHDGTSDDQKGDLIFKTNDGSDNDAPTEAARIDSSRNVLIGKTAVGSTSGIELRGSIGYSSFTRDGNFPVTARRLTDNGDIVQFEKDTTVVGSISSLAASGIAISNPQTNGFISLFGNNQSNGIFYEDGSSKRFAPYAARDNDIDLGYTTGRWKDLYLSGGAYIGGTTSANHLDDYEEGTWTPLAAGSSGTAFTYAENQGHYVKVGNYVTAWFNLTNVAGSMSGHLRVKDLPFAANWMSGFNGEGIGSVVVNGFTGIEGKYVYVLINDASTTIYFYYQKNTNNDQFTIDANTKVGSGSDVRGCVHYYTGG